MNAQDVMDWLNEHEEVISEGLLLDLRHTFSELKQWLTQVEPEPEHVA